jgi:hypothetical protein
MPSGHCGADSLRGEGAVLSDCVLHEPGSKIVPDTQPNSSARHATPYFGTQTRVKPYRCARSSDPLPLDANRFPRSLQRADRCRRPGRRRAERDCGKRQDCGHTDAVRHAREERCLDCRLGGARLCQFHRSRAQTLLGMMKTSTKTRYCDIVNGKAACQPVDAFSVRCFNVWSRWPSFRDVSCPASSLAPTFRSKECQEGIELIRVLSGRQFDRLRHGTGTALGIRRRSA